MGRWEMGNGTRQKTTSSPKNHKDGKKPQARPKTTKTAKNHKLAQKPQARPKTTKTAKKPHHRDFAVLWAVRGRNFSHLARSALRAQDAHQTWIDAPARGFWQLFLFLTRNALRAIQKPQARPKTTRSPKNHKLAQKPQGRQKTTSSPKNHKVAQKPQRRQKTTIARLLRFFGRVVGATLAILHAVRFAHVTRIPP